MWSEEQQRWFNGEIINYSYSQQLMNPGPKIHELTRKHFNTQHFFIIDYYSKINRIIEVFKHLYRFITTSATLFFDVTSMTDQWTMEHNLLNHNYQMQDKPSCLQPEDLEILWLSSWNIKITIIIYHVFLNTSRRGSHVKSDKTYT